MTAPVSIMTQTVQPLVLVVEDYQDAREMYAAYLQFSGYRVAEATNGLEAIEKTVELLPDIILMDLALPRMDGWEATRRLKLDERTRHIPIVALTGHALAGHAEGARQAGCDSFVTKPCLPDALGRRDSADARARARTRAPTPAPPNPPACPAARLPDPALRLSKAEHPGVTSTRRSRVKYSERGDTMPAARNCIVRVLSPPGRTRRCTGTVSEIHRFPSASAAAARTAGGTIGSSPSSVRRRGHDDGRSGRSSSISGPSMCRSNSNAPLALVLPVHRHAGQEHEVEPAPRIDHRQPGVQRQVDVAVRLPARSAAARRWCVKRCRPASTPTSATPAPAG